jgi:septal ring factor EnvC (AmiA/AmiB activator)
MANRFCSILVFTGLMVFTVSPVISPQDQESNSAQQGAEVSKEQLHAIEQEIQNLRQQANKLAEQENSIISQLDQFEVEYQMKSHEIELLDLRQQKTRADIAALNQQFKDLNESLEKQRAHLSARLVDAYKLGRLNYLKLMLPFLRGMTAAGFRNIVKR